MRFAMVAAFGAAAVLAGCGGKSPPPAAVANASASPAAACPAGALPITGLCADAIPAQFGKINARAELLDPQCAWRTMEVQRKPDEMLVLRAQSCDAVYKYSLSFPTPKELRINENPTPGQPPIENMVATIIDLAPGQTAEDAAMATLSEAPEAERPHCTTKLMSNETSVAGQAFQLEPDDELKAKLKKDEDGPISACGPYGYAEDYQELWEARPAHAIFHSLGQDTAAWDPASFTFYRRDASGAWKKTAD